MNVTTNMIEVGIAKGAFQPHQYLSNVCLSYFQNGKGFVSDKIFPRVPVQLSTSFYYEFNKGDLSRNNMGLKPIGGTVAPMVIGHNEKLYKCDVFQVRLAIDKITSLDFARNKAPITIDPRKSKIRVITEQMKLHQDVQWAKKFFNADSWGTVYTGVSNNPTGAEFYQFDNDNSDPVEFINTISTRMGLSGLRKPNKMCMGAHVMAALKTNPAILDRIKYQGSESNPASVTTNVLAQLFGLDEIVVSEVVVNRGGIGEPDDMAHVCNPNDILLVYATDSPSVEEPSAGYTFTWDMLGNGVVTPVSMYAGENGTHTEIVEGLIATDHKVTCSDLGVYLKSAVRDDFTV